jgi:hypothetical protein
VEKKKLGTGTVEKKKLGTGTLAKWHGPATLHGTCTVGTVLYSVRYSVRE